MAWNPSPTVAAARDFGRKFGRQQVIIISIDNHKGIMEATTYGQTMSLCAETRVLGDIAYKAVYDYLDRGAPVSNTKLTDDGA